VIYRVLSVEPDPAPAADCLSRQQLFGRPVQVCVVHHPAQAVAHLLHQTHDVLLVDGHWSVDELLALVPVSAGAVPLLMVSEHALDKAPSAQAGGYADHLVQDGQGRWLQRLPGLVEDALKRARLHRSLRHELHRRHQHHQRLEAHQHALSSLEAARRRQDLLLKSLAQAQSRFIANASPQQVLTGLLESLLEATESDHGFMAEVVLHAKGARRIGLRALADRTGRVPSEHERGLEHRLGRAMDNPTSLLGMVVRRGESVISNALPEDDWRALPWLPEWHRPFQSFLGLPVLLNGQVVGLVGLANKPGGYRNEDAERLSPLLTALAQMAAAWRSQAARAKAERALQLTLSNINQGLLCINHDGRVEFFNDRVVTLLGLNRRLLKKSRRPVRDQPGHSSLLGPDAPGTFWLQTPAHRTLEIQVQVLPDGCSVRTYTDVTDYMQVQQALKAGEQRHREMADQLQTILEAIPDLLYEFDEHGGILYVGKGHPGLLGGGLDSLGRITVRELLPPEAAAEVEAAIAEASLCGASLGHQYRLDLPDGTRWYELSMTRREPRPGQPPRFVMLSRDITQRRLIDERIQHMAYHDALTNLPNRRLMQDRLARALKSAKRLRQHGALLFIDLDNFKDFNDTLGHDQGDELLQRVAVRLRGCVRDADTVARLGGDEFLLMIEGLGADAAEAAAQADQVARKVLTSLRQPYELAGREHSSTPSIGVALFGQSNDTVEDLLKRADLAMYRAKVEGRNTVSFFDPELQAKAMRRAELEADMRVAMREEQWLLYFQPVVDEFGHVLGAEALVRWRHPQRGMVSPAVFIPVAEQSGMILAIGQWVLRQACACLAEWARHDRLRHWTLSVNVSAREFRQPDFVERVREEVLRAGVAPYRLKLEVTESMFMHDADEIAERMSALRAFGIRFSLDDFGTGYSSLGYLKRLPLDEIKIDQSFVRDVLDDEDDAAIVRAVLTLAHTLGLSVVAEGVEQPAQQDFLARHGCRAFQGFLFGRPVSVSEASSYAASLPVSTSVTLQ